MFKAVSASEGLVQQMMKRHPGLQNWMNPSLPFFRKDTMLIVNMRNDKDDFTLPSAPVSQPPTFVKKGASNTQKVAQPQDAKEKEREKQVAAHAAEAAAKEMRRISGLEAAAKIGLKIGNATPAISSHSGAPSSSTVTAQVVSNAVNLNAGDRPRQPLTNSEMVSLYSDPLWGAQAAQDDADVDKLNDLLSDVLGDAADLLDDDDGDDTMQVTSTHSPPQSSPPQQITQAPQPIASQPSPQQLQQM